MMPFTYRFNLPSLPEVEGTIVFQEWIAANRAHVLPGTPVALIAVSGKRYRILANGDAYYWETWPLMGRIFPTANHILLLSLCLRKRRSVRVNTSPCRTRSAF